MDVIRLSPFGLGQSTLSQRFALQSGVKEEEMAYQEDATCGIFREGDHWRHFHTSGDHPGKFADDEAARWGCNVTPEDAVAINAGGLITMEDVRASIRKRLAQAGGRPDE